MYKYVWLLIAECHILP